MGQKALLLLVALLLPSRAAPLPGQGRGPKAAAEPRLIVRYARELAGASPVIAGKARALEAMEGVLKVAPLPRLGMAVVSLRSDTAAERLMEDLDADPDVDLAVPDSRVHLLGENLRGVSTTTAPALTTNPVNPAACSSNPGCAELGLVGDCCPAVGGTVLECCKVGPPQADHQVAFKSTYGKYLTAEVNGVLTSTRTTIRSWEKFTLLFNAEGTYSLRTRHGRYVNAEVGGALNAYREENQSWERFELVYNSDGTVSLRTYFGKYVAVDAKGSVSANSTNIERQEKFQLVNVGGLPQRYPNDPLFQKLWGMHHYDSKDISAPEAWATFTGENAGTVVVGIIDTGIDYEHEDLKEQMWVNTNEIPNNGIDDDNNGFVDDIHGANFVDSTGSPMDDHEHGTHCAGTIAAAGNNGKGTTGIAWRGVRLMALKFLAADGGGSTSDAIRAIEYGLAHGARVLSNSWGGGGSNSALRVAIERAEDAGTLFIVAAGNSASNNDESPQYPASYPIGNIISVASTTVRGPLSSFSCYGRSTVHVAAPGSGIYSTVPRDSYRSLSGTSMACPHVSGLAALVWLSRPGLTAHQVREVVLGSAVQDPVLKEKVITGGRISVVGALEKAARLVPPQPPMHPPLGLEFEDMDPTIGAISGVANITAAEDESDVSYYRIYYVSGAGFALEALATVQATGERTLSVPINGSKGLPGYATGMVVVSGNATGEMPVRLSTSTPFAKVEDYGVPTAGPRLAAWSGDTDLRSGLVSGVLKVARAEDESTISEYHIRWVDASGQPGASVASFPSIGYTGPHCEGADCRSIKQTAIEGGYRFDRRDYSNNEGALITATGPATVIIRRFDTEETYDYLQVGVMQFSGRLTDLPLQVDIPPGMDVQILWSTDASIARSGWTFDLIPAKVWVQVDVLAAEPQGVGFDITAAYHGTEGPIATYVEVEDYTEETPPSPAFVPTALRLRDSDPLPEVVAGLAEVVPQLSALSGNVAFYQVDFADAQGQPLAGGWTAKADAIVTETTTTTVASPGDNATTSAVDNWDWWGGRLSTPKPSVSPVVVVAIPATRIPVNATQLIARAGNAYGLSKAWASLPLAEPDSDYTVRASSWRPSRPVVLSAGDLKPRGQVFAEMAEETQPWLQQEPVPEVLWQAMTAAAVEPRVLSGVTLPGLSGAAATSPELRRALVRALAAALPGSEVHVRRILAPAAPSAPVAEFEATPSDAAYLDRLEARILLLNREGAPAAVQLREALARALVANGAVGATQGVAWRPRLLEPRQLLLAANRRLTGASQPTAEAAGAGVVAAAAASAAVVALAAAAGLRRAGVV